MIGILCNNKITHDTSTLYSTQFSQLWLGSHGSKAQVALKCFYRYQQFTIGSGYSQLASYILLLCCLSHCNAHILSVCQSSTFGMEDRFWVFRNCKLLKAMHYFVYVHSSHTGCHISCSVDYHAVNHSSNHYKLCVVDTTKFFYLLFTAMLYA